MTVRYLVLGVVLCLPVAVAQAQAQAQVQVQAPAPAPAPTARTMPAVDERGDARALLQIQRSGAQAGPGLPMTGEQAALGYERYLESFRYAIPEFFTSQATGSPLRGGSGSQALGQ